MKKWIFFIIVLLLLGYGFTKFNSAMTDLDGESKSPDAIIDIPEVVPLADDGFTINVTKEMIFEGDLLLVNKDHPVPKGLNPESEAVSLVKNSELIDGFGVLDNTIQLSPWLVDKFRTMIKAAAQEGVNDFLISSGYRNEAKQDELYRNMGSEYALPAGYSEHNLGLSMDIGSSQADMSQAPEGKWLKDNAWKYGFILRYPEDKTAETGIQFEPWHFRYVGLPHSAIMQEKNLVLEEYLDLLKQQESVSITIAGKNYKVFYFPVTGDNTITVPAQGKYEISGNNEDGVIVTVHD
jgi:D-alanyl-D-alanine carboxypeptidase